MWKLRLEEMQNIDDTDHHPQLQQQQPRRTVTGRYERPSWRRMSVSDLRSEQSVRGHSGVLRSLPRLFSRLVTGFSRSLASVTPRTSYDLTSTATSSSSSELEPHHISLDDEVD